jgi:hypothetical protein
MNPQKKPAVTGEGEVSRLNAWGRPITEQQRQALEARKETQLEACQDEQCAELAAEKASAPETPPDAEWQSIADQIDFCADLDREYWRQRREREYERYLERKYRR